MVENEEGVGKQNPRFYVEKRILFGMALIIAFVIVIVVIFRLPVVVLLLTFLEAIVLTGVVFLSLRFWRWLYRAEHMQEKRRRTEKKLGRVAIIGSIGAIVFLLILLAYFTPLFGLDH